METVPVTAKITAIAASSVGVASGVHVTSRGVSSGHSPTDAKRMRVFTQDRDDEKALKERVPLGCLFDTRKIAQKSMKNEADKRARAEEEYAQRASHIRDRCIRYMALEFAREDFQYPLYVSCKPSSTQGPGINTTVEELTSIVKRLLEDINSVQETDPESQTTEVLDVTKVIQPTEKWTAGAILISSRRVRV